MMPLHVASENGLLDIVTLLIKHGTDVSHFRGTIYLNLSQFCFFFPMIFVNGKQVLTGENRRKFMKLAQMIKV